MSPSFSSERRIGVVVVAGGSGQRLGYGIPKAQVPLAGEPMLAHTLRAVHAAGIACAVAVAVPAGDTVMRAVCSAPEFSVPGFPVRAVDGGATRPESVRAALALLPPDLDAVLVHDAARALTPPEVFRRVAAALADGAQAVIPAVPVVDTIKDTEPVRPEAGAGAGRRRVTGTPDRSRLRAVQTPQGFDAALLRRAHQAALSFDPAQAAAVTDDAMLAESLGTEVYVVEGSQLSLKITTPLDLVLAEAVLSGGYRHPEK